jgi:FG-GAP-like repeat
MRVLLRPTHPPVFDAAHRPITAGGFVDGAAVVFEDVTRQSGLDKFTTTTAGWICLSPDTANSIPTTHRVAIFKARKFLVARSAWPESRTIYSITMETAHSLISAKAGVSDPKGYYGFASTFVDVDDDGWVDLLVGNDSRQNYLYRNRHDGSFEDISYPVRVCRNRRRPSHGLDGNRSRRL